MPDVSVDGIRRRTQSTKAAVCRRPANWWSAFVIGLAGTILVTGIAPTMVTSLGAAAIPTIVS